MHSDGSHVRKIRRKRGRAWSVICGLMLCLPSGFWPPETAASSISEKSLDRKQVSYIVARSWCWETAERILRNSIRQQTRTGRHEELASIEEVERFAWPILRYSRLYGVDPHLTRAIIWVESRGNPRSISPKGAKGLMQLMPGTARAMGVRDPFNVDQNIRGGLHYLKHLLDRFGKVERALWAYNAGPRAVWEGHLPAETMSYINRVLFVRSYLMNGQGGRRKQ